MPIIAIMEIALAAIGVFLTAATFIWHIFRARAQRRADVRVTAQHQGMGLDIYGPQNSQVEQVIVVRAINDGEASTFVISVGLESVDGERIADDLPESPKLIDSPAPIPRELPARGQVPVRFKVPAEALPDEVIGFVELGTGQVVRSTPVTTDPGLASIHSDIQGIVDDLSPPEGRDDQA